MKAAWMRIERGDRAAALAIVWPMISDQPLPGADAALKPIKLSSGWLWSDTAASAIAVDIARVLSAVGKIEHNQTSVSASLLGYWLAAELLRQSPADEAIVNATLQVSGELALAEPARQREARRRTQCGRCDAAGDPARGGRPHDRRKQRAVLVEQIKAHVLRYKQVGQLETGVSQFIAINAGEEEKEKEKEKDAKALAIQRSGTLGQLPAEQRTRR